MHNAAMGDGGDSGCRGRKWTAKEIEPDIDERRRARRIRETSCGRRDGRDDEWARDCFGEE